ncbi:hypothetical protein BASA81_004146 [Batrachochytrium salamandrivorans]|nr:hypothetical protein BASA81_004146 [Batrachochytrium salamandrivorans]
MKKSKAKSSASSAKKQDRAAILDSLDNPDDKLRMEGCSSIASKFEPRTGENHELELSVQKEILRLSKDGMFPLLIKCAMDKHAIVRLSAIGALRNISLTGGEKAMAYMQQADSWSALVLAVEQGDPAHVEMDLAIKRESLRVMDSLCENSSAVAEKRLPDSLEKLATPCFLHSNVRPHVLESATKLLFRATQGNVPLGQAMSTTEAGKQIGLKLEHLAQFTQPDSVLTSAYAFGTLVNLCLVSQLQSLPQLLTNWLGNIQRDLFHPNACQLPHLADDAQVLLDATDLEENDMEENGKVKLESTLLQQWLDRVQAQTIVLEVLTELLQVENAQSLLMPLREQNWLGVCMQFCGEVWNRETVGPNTLLFPIAKLQQSAAECAAACIDQDFPLPNNSYFSLVQVMGQITLHREINDRMIAFTNCLLAISRKQPVIAPQLLLDQLVLIQTKCPIIPVRALMAHCLAKMSCPLVQIGTLLIQSAKEDTSLVVVCEVIDVLLDLFAEDAAQPMVTQLCADEMFQQFVSRFDRRFMEWKRTSGDDNEDGEKMYEVRENAQSFVQWRRSL